MLLAGSGRTILLGGTGSDTLTGGSNDDLLVHGTTAFDANTTALFALLAEWQRTDRTYARRIADLRSGKGLNGKYKLASATVTDDAFADACAATGATIGSGAMWDPASSIPFSTVRRAEIVN